MPVTPMMESFLFANGSRAAAAGRRAAAAVCCAVLISGLTAMLPFSAALAAPTVYATITVGSNPEGIAITPDGSYAYVANGYSNTVSVIDTATNAVSATIRVGDYPYGVAVSPDGSYAYVTNIEDGTLSVISTATNAVVSTVAVGTGPASVAITPDGSYAYVTNEQSGTVSVINTATDAVSATVPVGSNPFGVAITPDGSAAYVTNRNIDGTVSVIDTATNVVTATVSVAEVPSGIAITPDGSSAYVTNTDSETVSVIDVGTNTVTASVPVGLTDPQGIAITPDGSYAYVVNSAEQSVTVISTAANTVSATLAVGSPSANDVAINPDGSYAYVTSPANPAANPGTVTVITVPASTATALSSSSDPSSYGSAVTLTATVSPTDGAGSVSFSANGSPISGCADQQLSLTSDGYEATCTTSALAVGLNTITAAYSGDASYWNSSGTLSGGQDVQGQSSAALSSSANPSTYGKPVLFTADVSQTDGGGTVSFSADGSAISGCNSESLILVQGSYQASCGISSLEVGPHSIQAAYSGDAYSSPSTSPPLTQDVTAIPTSTSVAASSNPAQVAHAVTYTATVKGSDNGGTLTFDDGGAAIPGCANLPFSSTNGHAKCHVTYYSTGTHSITASYSGDANYSASTSATLTETVNPAATTTKLSASVNPATMGKAVIYSAKVWPIPDGGTVAFSDAGRGILACRSVAVNTSTGKATCKVTYRSAGMHSITAAYSGDSNYDGSTSSTLIENVNTASLSWQFGNTA